MYTEERLKELVAQIRPLDEEAMAAARARQDTLAKPLGSLGRLEELSIQLAGIAGKMGNRVDKRRLIVLAADNGVVEEGISITPQVVTLNQTINLTRAKTGASTLAKHFGDEIQVVDVGVNAEIHCPEVVNRKIAYGTRNLAKEDAMTRQQAIQGLLTGIELAKQAKDEGIEILGTGEMGIGNTTTSSALLAVFLNATVEEVTGRGGGMTDEGFQHKKEVIAQAIADRAPDRNDPIDVLAKLGGFDIAAMAGVFLGAAIYRLPVVIDGFISVVAALTAARICPLARDYMIPSHASYERGYRLAMEALELRPMLLLDMRLGEGSGCPIAFQVVSAGCAILNDMATFAEAEINDQYIQDFKEQEGSF
jgi:nicotinate-nucleotide--dimethylbenzimidazole phosphoribosyltransferase